MWSRNEQNNCGLAVKRLPRPSTCKRTQANLLHTWDFRENTSDGNDGYEELERDKDAVTLAEKVAARRIVSSLK